MRILFRLIVLLLGTTAMAVGALAAPRLTIPETEFDFGFSPQNSAISHIFWLHSTGDDSLKIVKVTPGCGCTQTPLQKDHLAAGDSTQLEVIFSTGQYSNQVTKTPRIATNEGPPDKMVRITTYVRLPTDSSYPVVITPEKIELPQGNGQLGNDMKFAIRNVSQQTLSPTLVSSPSEFVEIILPKQIGAGKTGEGTIRVKKEFIDKAFGKSFTLQFNDEKKSRFTVPVMRTLATAEPLVKPKATVPAGQH